MLEFVGTWIISIIISVVSDKLFAFEAYKIVANYGYKNKSNNLYDLPKEMIPVSDEATLMPIFNILVRMYGYAYLKRNTSTIINELISLDIIEEMNEQEKERFKECPIGIRAINIYLDSMEEKDKIQSIEMVIDGQFNKITYKVSDDSKNLEILEVTGPLKHKGLSKKEIEKIILDRWMELLKNGPRLFPNNFSKMLSDSREFKLEGITYEDENEKELNITDETFHYNIYELEKLFNYFKPEENEVEKVKVKAKNK